MIAHRQDIEDTYNVGKFCRAFTYRDKPWSVTCWLESIMSLTDCCCTGESGHWIFGTSTLVLPRRCSIFSGNIESSGWPGTPLVEKTSRTAVSSVSRFSSMPNANSCWGDLPRSELSPWLFHCPRNISRSSLIRGRKMRCSNHKSNSLVGSVNYKR